jgi:hypothetical protein
MGIGSASRVIQPCVSAKVPRWIPVSVSRRAMVTSPGSPSATVNSPSPYLTTETGVMTAAVPQANTSVISPAATPLRHSSTSILRSSTANPASVANCSNEFRDAGRQRARQLGGDQPGRAAAAEDEEQVHPAHLLDVAAFDRVSQTT